MRKISRVQARARLLAILFACSVPMLAAHIRSPRAARVLEVTNTLDFARSEAIIEVPLEEATEQAGVQDPAKILAADVDSGAPLTTQLAAKREGGRLDTLLVLINIAARQTVRVEFREVPSRAEIPSQPRPLVFGRLVPERKDDFAWENDKVAYRVYGPALEATGEISSGIDVWSKRVPALIVDDWYERDAEGARTKNPALSYHKDDGTGLDSYDVGHTRGCGGTAVWSSGKLSVSKNFTSAKILASGPIRFSFELDYAPWAAGGTNVTERKIVTLDAGSHLNEIQSTFSFEGRKFLEVALGLATHAGAEVSAPIPGKILSVWEPLTDPSAGSDGTAILMSGNQVASVSNAEGNALFVLSANSGEPLTYFAGAAWSKSDMPTQQAWNDYLREFHLAQEHPLELHWK
jgi:hypothetical protein